MPQRLAVELYGSGLVIRMCFGERESQLRGGAQPDFVHALVFYGRALTKGDRRWQGGRSLWRAAEWRLFFSERGLGGWREEPPPKGLWRRIKTMVSRSSF